MKISEKEWNEKVSVSGNEKREKIMEVLVKEGICDIVEIRKVGKEKWIWSSLKKLEEDGKIESRKIGKKKFYKIKEVNE
jgi:DNA-binding transcriptional ArsR family regulator